MDSEEDVYNTEFAYGVNLNTNAGLIGGVILKKSRRITGNMYHYFFLEAVNYKHPNEYRLPNGNGNTFTLYKQNYLFVLRPQYGRELVLFRKAPDEGIQISGIAAAGPSVGIVKPYYVTYERGSNAFQYSSPYNPNTSDKPIGAGNFFDGFDEAKFRIGANIKAAISFELGTFRNSVTGFEVGVLAEVFTQRIAVMDASKVDPQNVFTSAYINIFFGSRR